MRKMKEKAACGWRLSGSLLCRQRAGIRDVSGSHEELVRRQLTAVPKAMTGRRTCCSGFPVPDMLGVEIANGGPGNIFLLSAHSAAAQQL